jgi:hypothetical protein
VSLSHTLSSRLRHHVLVQKQASFTPLVGAVQVPVVLVFNGFEPDSLVSPINEHGDAFARVLHEDSVGSAFAGSRPTGDIAQVVFTVGV